MFAPPQRSMRHFLLFLLFFLSSSFATNPRRRKDGVSSSRHITINNLSGRKMDIFWVKNAKELGPSNTEGEGMVFGGTTGISSYVGHEFEVQEMGKHCEKTDTCRKTRFICKDAEEQEFTVKVNDEGEFYVEYTDARAKAEEAAKRALETCQLSVAQEKEKGLSFTEQFDALEACVLKTALEKVESSKEEITFQSEKRVEMGTLLKDYICHEDPNYQAVNLTVSESIKNETYWETRQVQTLFESTESNIKLYKNFLEPSECQTLWEAATNQEKEIDEEDESQKMIVQKMASYLRTSTGEPKYPTFAELTGKITIASSTTVAANQPTSVQGRMLVFCPTVDMKGGVLFFPRAGVRIVPQIGDAVVVGSLERTDETDFIREYTMCGVYQGTMVTITDENMWD